MSGFGDAPLRFSLSASDAENCKAVYEARK